jgi:hypothetical protein
LTGNSTNLPSLNGVTLSRSGFKGNGGTAGTGGTAGENGGDGLIRAVARWNFLLRRDLGHGNDNSPIWINAAA